MEHAFFMRVSYYMFCRRKIVTGCACLFLLVFHVANGKPVYQLTVAEFNHTLSQPTLQVIGSTAISQSGLIGVHLFLKVGRLLKKSNIHIAGLAWSAAHSQSVESLIEAERSVAQNIITRQIKHQDTFALRRQSDDILSQLIQYFSRVSQSEQQALNILLSSKRPKLIRWYKPDLVAAYKMTQLSSMLLGNFKKEAG